jgi:hypothetical protein
VLAVMTIFRATAGVVPTGRMGFSGER